MPGLFAAACTPATPVLRLPLRTTDRSTSDLLPRSGHCSALCSIRSLDRCKPLKLDYVFTIWSRHDSPSPKSSSRRPRLSRTSAGTAVVPPLPSAVAVWSLACIPLALAWGCSSCQRELGKYEAVPPTRKGGLRSSTCSSVAEERLASNSPWMVLVYVVSSLRGGLKGSGVCCFLLGHSTSSCVVCMFEQLQGVRPASSLCGQRYICSAGM